MIAQQVLTLIEQKALNVNDKPVLTNLLNRLKNTELEALLKITRYLIDKGYAFSVEVYDSLEDGTEHLYYLIHFDPETTDEIIDDEILKIMQYSESVDNNRQLWFVNIIEYHR